MPEKIPDQPIVLGQRVRSVKVERARDLRRTMTHAERLLWQPLRDSQLGGLRWRRQQVIDGFIVDFYCHAAKVVWNWMAVCMRNRQNTTRLVMMC